MKVKDLMSRRLFALPDSATAEAAARLMSKENIGLLRCCLRADWPAWLPTAIL